MTSLTLNVDVSIGGLAQGVPTDSALKHSTGRSLKESLSSGGSGATLANNLVDKASEDQTLAAGGTVTIDFSSFTNVLIQSAQSVTAIRAVYVEHVTGSASSGISVFNAVGNSFQGPVSAAATVTLAPGEDITLRSQTATGFVVDGTHKNFLITNNDGVHAATIRYLIGGS